MLRTSGHLFEKVQVMPQSAGIPHVCARIMVPGDVHHMPKLSVHRLDHAIRPCKGDATPNSPVEYCISTVVQYLDKNMYILTA